MSEAYDLMGFFIFILKKYQMCNKDICMCNCAIDTLLNSHVVNNHFIFSALKQQNTDSPTLRW